MSVHIPFTHSFALGTGCFHILALMDSAAVNTGLQLSLQHIHFNSFLEVGMLGHTVVLLVS